MSDPKLDFKYLLRKGFYEALNNKLIDQDNNPVFVADGVQALDDTTSLYVILDSQSGTASNNQQQFASHEQFTVYVVRKDPGRVAKSQVDVVAGQILALILPSPQSNGINPQTNVQFLNVQLMDDSYQDFYIENNTAVIRRLLTFEIDVYQNS